MDPKYNLRKYAGGPPEHAHQVSRLTDDRRRKPKGGRKFFGPFFHFGDFLLKILVKAKLSNFKKILHIVRYSLDGATI